MQDRKEQDQKADRMESAGHGPQGIDKAPGEESSQDNVQFTQESQKGKKVDADLEREEDHPLKDQDL